MSRLLAQVSGVSRDAGSYDDKLETYGSRLDRVRAGSELQAALVGEILVGPRPCRRARGGWRASSTSGRSRSRRCAAIWSRRGATPTTDGLTGLANRKYFDYALAAAADDARVKGVPLCLLLADSTTSSASTTPMVTRSATRCYASSRRC